MVNSYGKRAGTRQKFSKDFRKHGLPGLKKQLAIYKVGNFVDVKVDSAVQKGMPFQCYHGKTGKVFNITQRGIGVMIKKQVRQRKIIKRIYVRHDHVRLSRCQADVDLRQAARKRGEKVEISKPALPKEGRFVKVNPERVERLEPQKFVESYF
eukprot:GHVP01048158.1.p1 GENE.GHVP01048158.1~~GHVP01048158.1.p1  ORF type:complete len:153 (+),score=18.29 GHVP01048158.1:46-504(+)